MTSDTDPKPWTHTVQGGLSYNEGYEAGLRDAALYGAKFILRRRGQWTAALEAAALVEERPRLRRFWRGRKR